jgi:hypothetical protein
MSTVSHNAILSVSPDTRQPETLTLTVMGRRLYRPLFGDIKIETGLGAAFQAKPFKTLFFEENSKWRM